MITSLTNWFNSVTEKGSLCVECASIKPHNEHNEDCIFGSCRECKKALEDGCSCCPPDTLCRECSEETRCCYKCGKEHPRVKSARSVGV